MSLFVEPIDSETHKTCGDCGKKKPVAEFYRDGNDSNGMPRYRRDCKKCYNDKRDNEKRMAAKKAGKRR